MTVPPDLPEIVRQVNEIVRKDNESYAEEAGRDAKTRGNGRKSGFEALFGFPIVRPRRWSQNLRTAIEVDGPHGEQIRWERQLDLASPRSLVLPVVSAGLPVRRKMPTNDEAVAIYGEIVEACEVLEAEDVTAEALSWAQAVLNHSEPVDISAMDAPAAWLQWRAMQSVAQLSRGDLAIWEPIVICDGVFEYIRLADVAAYARQIDRVTVDWEVLKARLAEAGWAYHYVQVWEPQTPRAEADRAVVRTFRRRLDE